MTNIDGEYGAKESEDSTWDIEDFLPVTPLQEGLIFHSLYGGQAQDPYVVPMVLELDGPLDTATLRASVQALVNRHPSLRAGFVHEGLDQPVQIIPRRVEIPWRVVDLSDLDVIGQNEELSRLLEEDSAGRFDLEAGPLLRIMVVRLSSRKHQLVITSHHLIWDGWSVPVLVRELFEIYAAGADSRGLAPAPLYRDFLSWLSAQDRDAAEIVWREVLAGVDGPTLLAEQTTVVPAGGAGERDVVESWLSEELTSALISVARQCGTTMGTVLQGTWGVLLSRMTGRDDVVFGTVVSGRPAQLPGVESMIGLFINPIPIRLRPESSVSVSALLEQLQQDRIRVLDHQYLGLSDICRMTGNNELFDTLLVFENYPLDPDLLSLPGTDLTITGVSAQDSTHYPLDITVVPGSRMRLRLGFRSDVFDRSTVESLVARWVRVLEAVAADPGCR
ncbi:condensation domain-containing protein, partial [Nocardia sp. NPDC051981]|uniref:condensation domain-containing protein n=1 Tax=Nocardia sp. NPDC051981 TaxID=3155417 RepID=UPI0034315038